jgi:hypothetical protein
MNAVIDFIFSTYGITITQNDLTSIDELNRVCILNNAAYAISNNTLNWGLLTPDIGILDFLNAVKNKFNIDFFIDFRKKTCSIKFVDAILSAKAETKIVGEPTLRERSHKSISITHSTLSDNIVKESIKTVQELVDEFGFEFAEMDTPMYLDIQEHPGFTNDEEAKDKVWLYPSSQFIVIDRLRINDTGESNNYSYVYNRSAVGCLSQQLESEAEKKIEFNSKAAIHSVFQTLIPSVKTYAITPPGDDPIITAYMNKGKVFLPLLLVNLNEPDLVFSNEVKDLKPSDFPLCFSIYRGKLAARFMDSSPPENFPLPVNSLQPFGSCFPFDREGKRLDQSDESEVYPDTLSLQVKGENGLYERFFKFTDQFFQLSGLPFELRNFNPREFLQVNFAKKYLIDGTEAIVTEVKYTINADGITVDSVNGLTAKPLLNS